MGSTSVYGVMTAWEYGNFVAYHANRIPMSSRSPSGTSAAWMTATTEAEADTLLCYGCKGAEHVRSIVVDASLNSGKFLAMSAAAGRELEHRTDGVLDFLGDEIPHATYGDALENAMVTRLMRFDGKDLSRYRLVYESEAQTIVYYSFIEELDRLYILSTKIDTDKRRAMADTLLARPVTKMRLGYAYDAYQISDVKIFEVMDGSRIRVEAEPGTDLMLELPLYSSATDRSFVYSRESTADSTGNAWFTVPYWTTSIADTDLVRATGPYEIYHAEEQTIARWRTHVDEDDVRLGQTVRVVQ